MRAAFVLDIFEYIRDAFLLLRALSFFKHFHRGEQKQVKGG